MTKSLNIVARVHAYPNDHNAGAEWALHEMLRAMVRRGHRATVWLNQWAPTREPYEVPASLIISAVGFTARLTIAFSSRRQRHVRISDG